MHIFRLFRRSGSPAATRFEPRATPLGDDCGRANPDSPKIGDGTRLTFDQDQADDDLRGSDAILGLIGSRAATEAFRTRPAHGGAPGDIGDLISALYVQYCQALDNPRVSIDATDWVSVPAGAAGLPVDPHAPSTGSDSIEALLSGVQLLDHAFGPLRESDLGSLPESEQVPEILRLFAPPENLASTRRQTPALPPTLARREHTRSASIVRCRCRRSPRPGARHDRLA